MTRLRPSAGAPDSSSGPRRRRARAHPRPDRDDIEARHREQRPMRHRSCVPGSAAIEDRQREWIEPLVRVRQRPPRLRARARSGVARLVSRRRRPRRCCRRRDRLEAEAAKRPGPGSGKYGVVGVEGERLHPSMALNTSTKTGLGPPSCAQSTRDLRSSLERCAGSDTGWHHGEAHFASSSRCRPAPSASTSTRLGASTPPAESARTHQTPGHVALLYAHRGEDRAHADPTFIADPNREPAAELGDTGSLVDPGVERRRRSRRDRGRGRDRARRPETR